MTDEPMELVRGSGDLYADFGAPDAVLRQTRALLAAEIVRTLEADGMSVRAAHALTGVAAADFSRLRQARLDRFTIDRLMTILARLGREVEVSVVPAKRDAA
jgi:predicted XRE-type DNA-binding protein